MKTFEHKTFIDGIGVRAVFTEHPDRIDFAIKCDRRLKKEHMQELQKFVMPLLEKYDSDPRPTRITHPVSGERLTIFGDANDSIGFITPGDNRGN